MATNLNRGEIVAKALPGVGVGVVILSILVGNGVSVEVEAGKMSVMAGRGIKVVVGVEVGVDVGV